MEVIKYISHPHIVEYKDVFDTNTHTYIVMELVANGELGDLMRRNSISKSQTTKIAYQSLQAIKYLRDCGIVHRDLKPSNIMV